MDILDERELTHGDFADTARLAQDLKAALHEGITNRKLPFNTLKTEAMDMICTKLARIVFGNSNEPDHWRDIAGYAQLVVNDLEAKPED